MTRGRDVGWAAGDADVRPINAVLQERKAGTAKFSRAMRELAFRERAYLQAELASCLCLFPLEMAETSSRHPEWCPGHSLHESRRAAR